MSTPIAEVSGVYKVYRQGQVEVAALGGVTLAIHRGEFLVLSGPSGSGKTTLLNIMGGLDEPTSGTVRVEGRDLGDMSRAELGRLRRDRIGFVFQAYNLIAVLTAYENAELVLDLQGRSESERRARTMAALSDVGLAELAHRRPDQLSGGQQQRVAIARALAPRPALILADEPTANVDSVTAEGLLDLMVQLNQRHGATFVFSSHDPRVMNRARRIVHLLDGRIVSDETRT